MASNTKRRVETCSHVVWTTRLLGKGGFGNLLKLSGFSAGFSIIESSLSLPPMLTQSLGMDLATRDLAFTNSQWECPLSEMTCDWSVFPVTGWTFQSLKAEPRGGAEVKFSLRPLELQHAEKLFLPRDAKNKLSTAALIVKLN